MTRSLLFGQGIEVLSVGGLAKRDEISRISFAERKGSEEGREEVARRILALGLDAAVILQAVGYSEDELERLKTPG